MEHFIYILYSDSIDRYYVGTSEDVAKRLYFHNNPIESRKFTVRGLPWKLRSQLVCPDKPTALRVERYIKKMKSRKFIEAIVSASITIDQLIKMST